MGFGLSHPKENTLKSTRFLLQNVEKIAASIEKATFDFCREINGAPAKNCSGPEKGRGGEGVATVTLTRALVVQHSAVHLNLKSCSPIPLRSMVLPQSMRRF